MDNNKYVYHTLIFLHIKLHSWFASIILTLIWYFLVLIICNLPKRMGKITQKMTRMTQLMNKRQNFIPKSLPKKPLSKNWQLWNMLNNSSTDFSKVTLTVRLNVPSAWKTWQTLLLYQMVIPSTEKIYQTQSGSEDGNVQSLVNVLNRFNLFPISPCEAL